MVTWTSSAGLSYFVGGNLAQAILKRMGPRGYTSYAMSMGTIAYMFFGPVKTSWSMWIGQLVMALGCCFNAAGGVAVKGLATKHAVKSGMGAGEYAGQFANLRSLVYVIGPLLFTSLFKVFMERNALNPRWPAGLAWFVPGLLGYAMPGLLHLTWTNKDMLLEEEKK